MERANGFEPSTCTLARVLRHLENTENQYVSGYWCTLDTSADDKT